MSLFSRITNVFRGDRLSRDIDEELASHIEEAVAQGRHPHEARRAFGSALRLREESRDIRLWTGLESMLQDVRYAWRAMRKSPAFAVTAVLSLSLAIGANTAIYSIVDAGILRSLPVSDPQSLITVTTPDIVQAGSPASGEREAFSYPLYLQLRQAAGGSARLALFSFTNLAEAQDVRPGAPLEKVTSQEVSGEAFEILGVPPALGRVFSSQEDRVPGGSPKAVLSYEYWQRRFGGERDILERTLKVDGQPFRVIGVARQGFFGVEPGKFIDIWVPAMMHDKEAFTNPGVNWFRIIGRLSPGVGREQLAAQLQPALYRAQEEKVKGSPNMPEAIRKQFLQMAVLVHPAATGVSGFRHTFTKPLWIVFGVAIGILLIACANVANLLLARATARSAEMAMRVSLGAGRVRLVRQLLTEGLLLSAFAGFLGWLMARLAAPVLVSALSKEGNPFRFALALDSRVLFFCIGVSTLAAILFGLLPAWQASGTEPILALKGASEHGGKLRLGRFFVAVQVAFAFGLVIAGAAFLFSLKNLLAVDAGFDSRDVAVLTILTEADNQPEPAQRRLMEQFQERLAAQPMIQSAAVAPWAILEGNVWSEQVMIPGKPPSEREEIFYRVSPSYFTTLRTSLLTGRNFEARDSDSKNPVPVIVNQAFAGRYFGGASPLGKEFERPAQGNTRIRHVVVGVAIDSHYTDLRQGADPIVYLPLEGTNFFAIYVRSKLNLGSVLKLAAREALNSGSGTRVLEITALQTLVGNTLIREKLLAGLGGAFALLGLLLAAIGLFGILNYSVVRRTKEIGIRAALGAQRRELIGMVMKDLVALVGGGLIAGLAGALAVMQFLQSLLFGLRPADPVVIGTATLVFLAASIMAGALPARRAASVDPLVALRHE